MAKQRKLTEKKKSADTKEESAAGKDAGKELEGEASRLGQVFGPVPGENRDEPAEQRHEGGQSQSAARNTLRYAYGQKALEEQRQLEPTCRVLFVLRVVPTYAAKAKAAAALEGAASKIESDAVREAPAAKSK